MIKYHLHNPVYILLVALIFFTSCNGQNKTHLPVAGDVSTSNRARHTKMARTQGTSEFVNVHCGLQDKAGNLWFGTTGEGVYCYDGKFFTQFTMKDGLSSNTVWSVLEDRLGNIWFGTADGACCYNPSAPVKSGRSIICVPISSGIGGGFAANTTPLEKNEVWSMMQDKSGTLWFGTSKGVYCYNSLQAGHLAALGEMGAAFTRFLDNDSIVNSGNLHLKMVDCMLEDKHGNIWFGSGMPPGEEGICLYDGRSLTAFKPKGNGWIRTILEDRDRNIYFATRLYGVCRYNTSAGNNLAALAAGFTNFTEKAGIDNQSVNAILEDHAGNLWIATELGSGQMGEDGGLWRFDGKSFTRFTTKDGLIHNGVFCIVEDRAGNLWLGTRNNGLCRYNVWRAGTEGGEMFTSFSE